MTWMDWVIGGVFGLFIFFGYRKGFVRQIFELLGSIFSIILAFYFYRRFGAFLAGLLHCSAFFANFLAFTLIVVGISAVMTYLGRRWQGENQEEPVIIIDRIAGAVLGMVKAAVLAFLILLLFVAAPWDAIHIQIEASTFANDLLRLTPLFYKIQDRSLPPDFPRLVISPEGVRLRAIQESKLEGAVCLVCGSKVRYLGLVKQGLSSYPQTYCPGCHRTSDGCLTFEGYHMLNGVCPYERLGSMGVIDCKVWPNSEPATVHGKCPVCGRSQ
ncbi:MAG: CvpA family protein [Firmicutes bacterium]|nr:CvpA family protein [Bacillota bacterium]